MTFPFHHRARKVTAGQWSDCNRGSKCVSRTRSQSWSAPAQATSPAAVQVATDLRTLLATVKDHDTRTFVEEAVKCYEFELHRSAVVMSWLAAIHVLKKEVHQMHLVAFNTEAQRVDRNWKPAKTTDDIGLMKEFDFLDRVAAISMIGKNVKEELQKCLKLRNGCGHPSTLKVGPATVTSHIEILLLNVFKPFAQ